MENRFKPVDIAGETRAFRPGKLVVRFGASRGVDRDWSRPLRWPELRELKKERESRSGREKM
ncbi:unnamed protein product [Prunus armeniaca]